MLAEEYFQKLARANALSHAYLFSGNDMARKEQLLARLGEEFGWRNFQHPDLLVVEPAEKGEEGEITIAQIRALLEHFSLGAWSAPYKVAVLRHAHCMNAEAQSAFLKLLEEPKGNAAFFLLTGHPDMLLATIRSRAQEFRFYRFGKEEPEAKAAEALAKLHKAPLYARFAYAKKLADTPEDIAATLQAWLAASRAALHRALRQDEQAVPHWLTLVKTLQEVQRALATSNTNPRLALERLMLAF